MSDLIVLDTAKVVSTTTKSTGHIGKDTGSGAAFENPQWARAYQQTKEFAATDPRMTFRTFYRTKDEQQPSFGISTLGRCFVYFGTQHEIYATGPYIDGSKKEFAALPTGRVYRQLWRRNPQKEVIQLSKAEWETLERLPKLHDKAQTRFLFKGEVWYKVKNEKNKRPDFFAMFSATPNYPARLETFELKAQNSEGSVEEKLLAQKKQSDKYFRKRLAENVEYQHGVVVSGDVMGAISPDVIESIIEDGVTFADENIDLAPIFSNVAARLNDLHKN